MRVKRRFSFVFAYPWIGRYRSRNCWLLPTERENHIEANNNKIKSNEPKKKKVKVRKRSGRSRLTGHSWCDWLFSKCWGSLLAPKEIRLPLECKFLTKIFHRKQNRQKSSRRKKQKPNQLCLLFTKEQPRVYQSSWTWAITFRKLNRN